MTGDYACPRCGKRGDTEKGLRAHLAVDHGEDAVTTDDEVIDLFAGPGGWDHGGSRLHSVIRHKKQPRKVGRNMAVQKGPLRASSLARVRGVPEDQRHECCVTSCTVQTTPGFLACRDHYLRLPQSVRHTLRRAFTRREQRPDLYAEAVIIAVRLINTAAGEVHA